MRSNAIAKLAAVLRGELILPSDPRYEKARQIYNRRIDRRPAMIARCAGEDDVVSCVRLAREQEIPLSVRAGGHSPAGHSVVEGGLVIDLSAMKEVRIDAGSRVATVEAGALWRDLDRATGRHGLVAAGGIHSQVGVSGLVLVGGWGFLSRLHGLAADNLIRARIVDAQGRLRTVSDKENPELMWALRGAGAGNFGVVTSLELRLHRTHPHLRAKIAHYPLAAAEKLLPAMLSYMNSDAPRELFTFCSLRYHQGKPVLRVVSLYFGREDDADRALLPLEGAAPLAGESLLQSYGEFKERLSATVPKEKKALWKSGLGDAPVDAATVAALADSCEGAPGDLCRINFEFVNGAIHDRDPDATAFAHRRQLFCINTVALWDCGLGEETDQLNERWAREAHGRIFPQLSGRVYAGYSDSELTDFGRAYWGENYPRLCEIKREWDPDGVFGGEQAIGKPAGEVRCSAPQAPSGSASPPRPSS